VKLHLRIAILAGVLALVVPAAALATQPTEPGNGHRPAAPGNGHNAVEGGGGHAESTAPDYSPEAPPTTKAFGYYCKGESKQHVPGTPGTPFSACVTAHAKAAAHKNMSPGKACKGTIGRHIVKGEKGTPHSRCVATILQQRKEEREAAS
jgi:hypothetical protein